jgi:predicted lactoylglutathione lyase
VPDPGHPDRMLFVNIPVADLERSKAFFAELGFSYNPAFTDGTTGACMLVGEHAFVMLLTREKFAEFAKRPIGDPATHTLALYGFSVSSRDEVDEVAPRPRRPRLAGHVDGPGRGPAGTGCARGLGAGGAGR